MKLRIICSVIAGFFLQLNVFCQEFTEVSGANLKGVWEGNCVWGDYNNDGHLDVLVTGESSNGPIAKLYKNNGDGTFTEQTNVILTGVSFSSVAWGDYNGDGFLDILITGLAGPNNRISKIYKNNGNGTFTELPNLNLDQVYQGSISWGDYNNDGLLDILLAGYKGSNNYVAKVYKNLGKDSFAVDTAIVLPGVSNGYAIWADYDNDGRLDILLTGTTSSGKTAIIYRNDSIKGFVPQSGFNLTGTDYGAAAWGDYNNDGLLDLLISGYDSTGKSICKIYKNTGSSFIEQTNIILEGVSYSSAAWIDYNSDGFLDIILSGLNGTTPFTKLYKNDSIKGFVEDTLSGLPNVWRSSISWGDYNNDGVPDLLISGSDKFGNRLTKIFRNNSAINNLAPEIPVLSKTSISNNEVKLNWSKSTDDHTSINSLTYNLFIKNKNGNLIVPPMSNINTGSRLIPVPGNEGFNDSVLINIDNLPGGHYYWSVQAIDNSLSASSFATIDSFIIKQIQTITFPSINPVLYGSGDFSPTVNSSSGLQIELSSSDTSVAQIVNNKIHLKKIGTCNIISSQSGNADYFPAKSDTQLLTINKGLLTAVAENKTRTYGTANPKLTIKYSGFASGDDTSKIIQPAIFSNATKTSNVGNYEIHLNGGSSDNYNIVSDSGILTVTKANLYVIADSKTKYCGQPNPDLSVSYLGFLNNDNESSVNPPKISTSANNNSPVGKYKITISGGSAENYAFNYIFGTLNIVTSPPVLRKIIICNGDNYTLPNGNIITKSGTYADTLISENGCDSIINFEIIVVETKNITKNISICKGSSYYAGGKSQDQSGTYTDIIPSVAGCDSLIITTNLTIEDQPSIIAGTDQSICQGDSVTLSATGQGNISWQGFNIKIIKVGPKNTTTYTASATSVCGTKYSDITVTVNPIPDKPFISISGDAIITSSMGNLQWYNATDSAISGANNWQFKPLVSGDYYVITTINGCSSVKSNIVHFTKPLEIENPSSNEVTFSPNPFNENLEIKANFEIDHLEIINTLGKVELKNILNGLKEINLNTENLFPGVYFIIISSVDKKLNTVVSKIIKR